MTTYQITITIDDSTVNNPAEVLDRIVTEVSRLSRLGETTINSIAILS